jgi:serine/threonine protein kinase
VSTEGEVVGGRYRLDQPIGRGHAGIVWMAFDTRLHRTVALKPMYVPAGLPPAQAEQAKATVLEEGRNATRVTHGCAITVHDVFEDGTDIWLVMEYIPSRSMAKFLSEHGKLTPEQAASLGVLLGSTLAAMHAAGIVHRTLEPGNVLLADDGGVKITDIGITGGGPSAAYRAPEVTRGEPAVPASDVFSLGATLYTAVEGVPPFGQDGLGDPPALHNAGPLTGALIKLLRRDPVTRPTMNDAVRSLEAITEGRQTAFVPPTAPAMPTVRASMPAPQSQVPQSPGSQSQVPQQPIAQSPVPQPPMAQAQTSQFPKAQPQVSQFPNAQNSAPQPPRPTMFGPTPQAPQSTPPLKAKASRPAWLFPALAVLAAIVVGVLFAELFLL